MGCDIHAIIEIKQNGKWRYVEDLPDAFTDRNYAFFSMLNRNVRNNYGLHGFEGKGLPSDLSGQQFRFYSEKASLENGYSRTTFCCFVN